jgi:hypothetical protein
MLGDLDSKVMRENIFKPTIGSDSLHHTSNDNDVRIVKLATSKNFVVKGTIFLHRNILKYTWTSPVGQSHDQIDQILIVYWGYDLPEELTLILVTVRRLQKLRENWQ